MSGLVDRLNGLRELATDRRKALGPNDPLSTKLGALAEKAEALRREVVATKEGGAITGEERIREHLDYVYNGLLSDEGRPSEYQKARVATLERELDGVGAQTNALMASDLPPINDALRALGLQPVTAQVADEIGARWAAVQEYLRAGEAAAVTTRRERD